MKKSLLLLLASVLLASCSTYKTSDSDLTFSSIELNAEPVIPVGDDIDTQGKNIMFLGWIDVFVKKPNILEPDATEEQVNYVLAHTAAKRGANAVIHVSYKAGLNLTGQRKLFGRGQAVYLTPPLDQQPSVVEITPSDEVSEQAPAQLATPIQEAEKPVVEQAQPEIVAAEEESAPLIIATEDKQSEEVSAISEPEQTFEQTPEQIEAPQPQKVSAVLINQATPQQDTKKSDESSGVIIKAKQDAPIASDVPLPVQIQSIQGLSDEQNRLQLMLNSARFLEQKARKHKDKDMHRTTLNLIQLLESHQRFLSDLK